MSYLARFGFESLKFKEQVYFVKATCVKRGSIVKKNCVCPQADKTCLLVGKLKWRTRQLQCN